jgi:hypothetical protein
MWWWTGFTLIPSRVNQTTGEVIKLSPPVLLHHEDADWFFRSWDAVDRLGYEVHRATIGAAA